MHASTKSKVYMSGGYGTGKSHGLIMQGFKLMGLNHGLPGGMLIPSLRMFKRDIKPLVADICKRNKIPYKFNGQDYTYEFPLTGNTIYCFHDEPDSIKGPNLAFGLINEVTLCKKESFEAFLARIRLKKAKIRQIAMSGTPEGFGWFYDYFIKKPRKDTDLIFAKPRDNKHVAEDYFDMLADSYDELLQKQYIGGEFVNLSGNRAAWSFERQKHIDDTLRRDLYSELAISIDFNLNPMSAVLWNKYPNHTAAWKEVKLRNSDTQELCDVLTEMVGEEKKRAIIYPDPAGKAGSTKSAGRSDFDILEANGFKDIRYRRKFYVRDQLNALNNMFSKNRISINSETCPELISDLEQCILKDGGLTIDKSDSQRTHWLDGMKNYIHLEYPVRAKEPGARELRIR